MTEVLWALDATNKVSFDRGFHGLVPDRIGRVLTPKFGEAVRIIATDHIVIRVDGVGQGKLLEVFNEAIELLERDGAAQFGCWRVPFSPRELIGFWDAGDAEILKPHQLGQ